jgi:A/G-specific adenine glycosylase
MELGALLCTPREPQCGDCPIAKGCVAHRDGRVHELPELAKRPQVTQRRFVAFVAENRGQVLVRQRPAGVVNAHLWEFPNLEIGVNGGQKDRTMAGKTPFCTIKHSITRYRITLEAFRVSARFARKWNGGNERWVDRKKLDSLPFTSAHRKILAHFRGEMGAWSAHIA